MQASSTTKNSIPLINTSRISEIRQLFPIFSNQPGVLFFDNAATSQKPASVISTFSNFYSEQCSNSGRASYRFSTQAQSAIETTRKKVANFLNCSSDDLIFTSGASESLNAVASIWGLHGLKDGDEIILCLQDHRSAVLPWLNLQQALKNRGVNISILDVQMDSVGEYRLDDIRKNLSPRTRLIAITHLHHIYGQDIDVKKIREAIGNDILISLDASQSVSHLNLDLKQLDVDFVSFSGHKMFAGNGTGVLWVNPQRLGPHKHSLESYASEWRQILEHGTPNIPAILSLIPAISFIQDVGIDFIENHIRQLTHLLYIQLKDLPGIEFSPGIHNCTCSSGFGIVSFQFEQIGSIDLGLILDSQNILVRDGGFCQVSKDSSKDYIRVSLHVYNTEDEVEQFVNILKKYIAS